MQPPPPYYPPVPPPRRRNLPLVIALGALAFVMVILATVVVIALARRPDSSTGTLKGPLQFRKVVATTPSACTSGGVPSADGQTCYQLGEGMTVSKVRDISLRAPDPAHGSTSYAVEIKLSPSDADRLGTLTGETAHQQPPADQLAIVIDGKVISAPTVQDPITGGSLQIVGNFSRDQAQHYIDLMEP